MKQTQQPTRPAIPEAVPGLPKQLQGRWIDLSISHFYSLNLCSGLSMKDVMAALDLWRMYQSNRNPTDKDINSCEVVKLNNPHQFQSNQGIIPSPAFAPIKVMSIILFQALFLIQTLIIQTLISRIWRLVYSKQFYFLSKRCPSEILQCAVTRM